VSAPEIHQTVSREPPPRGRLAAGAIAKPTAESWRSKVSDWLRRYGIAECAGVACALVGSFAARRLTGSTIAAAYGGAWGETIGYSSVIILRDYRVAARAAHATGRPVEARDAAGVATGLLAEFGPAAILDTLVVRPFTMALGMRLIGPARGLIAGKLAADCFFYLPVIFMYERRKRAAGNAAGRR
jgi:hypothetical protein